MKHSRLDLFVGVLALGLAACSSAPPAEPNLFESDRAGVRAVVTNRGSRWRVRSVEALAGSGEKMSAFTVASFLDIDGDGAFDEGEQRGSWTVSTSIPSTRLAISGQVSWTDADPADPGRLFFETKIVYEDGTVEREVRKAVPSS